MFYETLLKAPNRFESPTEPVPTLLALLLQQPRTDKGHKAIHWRLDEVMTQFIQALITEYHVESSQDLYSCVVARLDHFVDTKGNFPREYIVAHVALPLPATSSKPLAPRTIGFLKFERCWRSYHPVDFYQPLEFTNNRYQWLTADDSLGVYDTNYRPWTSRRRTLLRSSRALAVPLARALAAACALRRAHPDCIENTYAHAWFARGLWERLVDSDAADGPGIQPDARSEDSGCSKWGLLRRCVPRKTPTAFLEVLKEKEVEECRAVEDRVLRELEAGRAELAVRLSGKAVRGEFRTTSDLREALDRGVWAGARGDLDWRSQSHQRGRFEF
ncbi:uncharacterized protein BXZ73DRAFT_77557 [Epithele typhae]|uniref:uncharacterized protein n=1 Tax=Epithele typhae TaxID=378194 RepID=UPI00200853D1|nr:uncharacterized protein BXZ73DRAFT_77557 [Epithele typhae]KAH9932033.1 hypothetical protein BXZ73DRAFT_77557 [Epithele typhae]